MAGSNSSPLRNWIVTRFRRGASTESRRLPGDKPVAAKKHESALELQRSPGDCREINVRRRQINPGPPQLQRSPGDCREINFNHWRQDASGFLASTESRRLPGDKRAKRTNRITQLATSTESRRLPGDKQPPTPPCTKMLCFNGVPAIAGR